MFLRTAKMRSLQFTTQLLRSTSRFTSSLKQVETRETKTVQPHFGDQSLFWWVLRDHPEFVQVLPRFWDMEGCHDYEGWRPGGNRPFGILHFNCEKNAGDGLPELFARNSWLINYWRHYELAWLDGTGAHPVRRSPNLTPNFRINNTSIKIKLKGRAPKKTTFLESFMGSQIFRGGYVSPKKMNNIPHSNTRASKPTFKPKQKPTSQTASRRLTPANLL
jgi:hypothetical protein